MNGDINKPVSNFMRWIDWFWDGEYGTTKKGKRKIPSQNTLKRYERRWRRRREKLSLGKDLNM